MGDPRLPDPVKRGGTFNPEDLETVRQLKDALSELPDYKFRYLDNHATLERDLGEPAHRPRLQPVRRGLQQRSVQGTARPGAARHARHCPTPAPAPPALAACYDKGLVRAVAHDARRAGAARDLRAARRPGRDAAVGVPGAAEAELRRQLAGHHQGRRGAQRERAARLPRAAARRIPASSGAGAGVPDRRRVLGQPHRQSRPGPARAADPRGRLLAARSEAAEDPRLRIEMGARQPLLDADPLSRGAAARPHPVSR